MENIPTFFADLLAIKPPFSIYNIEKVQNVTTKKIEHINIYIKIDDNYVPDVNSKRHSYYQRKWKHLNLFEYPCFIHCDVPVFINKTTGKTQSMQIPWAQQGSGLTIVLEMQILEHLRLSNCITQTAAYFGLYPQRVENIYHFYTKQPYENHIVETVEKLGIDETSTKKGHDYITVFVDMQTGKPIDIEDGRDGETILKYMKKAQKIPDAPIVEEVSMDMSPAFISGVNQYLQGAKMTFDKFHVVKNVNKHMDILLDNKQLDRELLLEHKQTFAQLWNQPTVKKAAAYLTFWTDRLTEITGYVTSIAKSINNHYNGIINYFNSKLTNALLEGINNKIQVIKRTARGYRYTENFKKMIMFAFGTI